jgi:hypothetical protein
METWDKGVDSWFDLVVKHPHQDQAAVQELDRISKLSPTRANFDKFRDANFDTSTEWTRVMRMFLHRMEEGRYRGEWRYFAGGRSRASQVGELFELFQLALHYNDYLKSNARGRKHRRNAESVSGGFAIGTWDEDIITEHARDKFGGGRYGDAQGRKHFLRSKLINSKGEITKKGWGVLNDDMVTLEHNSMLWLRENFESARDKGYGLSGELIGTFWYDLDDPRQLELIETGIEERIDMSDASYGDLADSVWDGVSDFGASVLGGQISFFGVELPE